MTLQEELTWRGLVNQVTHVELFEALEREPITFYCGFDPSADSLHIGSLVPIIGMMHLQRRGHKPIALVGGATGLVGDPSLMAQERALLDRDEVEANVPGIRAQLERFLDFEGDNAAVLLNNLDWLGTIPLLDFLRDIGKHFSVNVMMAKESVKQRLTSRDYGISYTEFSYSLLQSYDFLYLCDTYDCRLQVGGSDQWGNIVAGMDLTRRLRRKDTFGLTFPLITKSDGAKFGKTESGNVWLDPSRTSPYRFYQFWINQTDADVVPWLRYFTFLSNDEIAALEDEVQHAPERRAAQKRLAKEVTLMVHGQHALDDATRASQAMFGGDIKGLDDATLEDIFSEVPSTQLPRSTLSGDRLLVDVLVEAQVFESKGEARRMIKSGGLYLNNERVPADDAKLTGQSLSSNTIAVIRKGKKSYHLLRFVE